MKIVLNGENYQTEASSISNLLLKLEIEVSTVAVEHNRIIVPFDKYDHIAILDGDQIEIVQFVGGG